MSAPLACQPLPRPHLDRRAARADDEANPIVQRRMHRLDRMLRMARAYRGWTKAELSEQLGRESGRVVPESGNPKLDLLVRLADALEWGLGDLAEDMWADDFWLDEPEPHDDVRDDVGPDDADFDEARAESPCGHARMVGDSGVATTRDEVSGAAVRGADAMSRGRVEPASWRFDDRGMDGAASAAAFAELDLLAVQAHRAGDATRLLRLARDMRRAARTATERALAANREAGAWDLRGRYVRSLEAVQRGLAHVGVRDDVRLMLQVNLAGAHHALWHLVDARAIATDLLSRFGERPARTRIERVSEAFSWAIRGHTWRRTVATRPADEWRDLARRARHDLEIACGQYLRLAAAHHDRSYEALASTCRVGLLDCACILGEADPRIAVAQIIDRLGDVEDIAEAPRGDSLESYGWWALTGCTIARRHLHGDDLQRAMAICTNKAFEIAERLDNWSMREQAFVMEFERRQAQGDVRLDRRTPHEPRVDAGALRAEATARSPRAPGRRPPMRDDGAHEIDDNAWLLDDEDIRVLAGAMGRFPCFRPIGWRILDSARVLEPSLHAASLRRRDDDLETSEVDASVETRAPLEEGAHDALDADDAPRPVARAPNSPRGTPGPRPRCHGERAGVASPCGTPSVSLAMFARD